MVYHYAVKYLDENGHTISYGYIESMEKFNNGQVINLWSGQKILIDFEM